MGLTKIIIKRNDYFESAENNQTKPVQSGDYHYKSIPYKTTLIFTIKVILF
jgi:hypothetical protein